MLEIKRHSMSSLPHDINVDIIGLDYQTDFSEQLKGSGAGKEYVRQSSRFYTAADLAGL